MTKRKVAVTTLGCKVNQFESASFISGFKDQGCELVSASEEADILVVNTCAVTARAGQQSRQLIRKLRRSNPEARLLVTGCYAQLTGDELPELVSDSSLVVIGNADKHLLVNTALEQGCSVPPVKDVGAAQEICPLPVRRFSGRTRLISVSRMVVIISVPTALFPIPEGDAGVFRWQRFLPRLISLLRKDIRNWWSLVSMWVSMVWI
ncbi:hypothetical protein H206_01646 [Candidatus Electrothrix aarhusensis]|uniref:MTTase N-terminal domain-containing protein n=1 Tax=Candidatus Electrothrix aarhusensis TaxID=1859131 RepID=A0A3S3U686_9BACT|nr:hypothetical protein H206_01646 [Candidatus Electrothrix aarhusensis]